MFVVYNPFSYVSFHIINFLFLDTRKLHLLSQVNFVYIDFTLNCSKVVHTFDTVKILYGTSAIKVLYGTIAKKLLFGTSAISYFMVLVL